MLNTTTSGPAACSSVRGDDFPLHSTSSLEDCGRRCTRPEKTGAPAEQRRLNPAGRDAPYACPSAMCLDAWCTESGGHHVIQTRCNRWSCPGCGPLRTRQLCRRLATATPNRFITLTCGSPGNRTPREVWDDTRRQVPELIRRIRRELGPTEYARVLEVHQSGYPHFHLLVRGPFIEQDTLSRWWCELTDAYIVDIRRVRPHDNVASYIGKYLTKQLEVPFTNRRCTWSRGFFPPPPPREPGGLHLDDPRRESGTLAEYLARQYPGAEWELLTPYHAVRVYPDSDELGVEILA